MSAWLTTPVGAVSILAGALFAAALTYIMTARVRSDSTNAENDPIRRIAVNSAVPIASQLVVRGIDLAVAIFLLRLLGPAGNGRYALAVVAWLYVKTVSDFGLSLLATREIAQDRSRIGRIVGATTLFRLTVLVIASVPVAAYILAGVAAGSMTTDTALAIGLLLLSIVPSSYTEAVNSALNGIERMSLAAILNVGVAVVRAPLAVVAAANLDVPGVALAAVVAAVLSADLYRRTLSAHGYQASWSLSRVEAVWLARESWPLLINALLVSLFFRVDVFVIQAFRGDRLLGLYDAAYKLINLVTIIPAYATLALFPAMATRATDPRSLVRVQRLASYLLVWIAWGIVVVVAAASELAIRLLAGDNYLPASADLLRILIWFAPLSFLNGVAQYVLVAAGEQRRLVPAFLAAVVFNLIANLVLVPSYGALASATVTVATEFVILAALVLATRSTPVPAFTSRSLLALWKPTLAGTTAAAVAIGLSREYGQLIALTASVPLFLTLSAVIQVFGTEERAVITRAIRRSGTKANGSAPSTGAHLP